jgi:sulfopyruvate decarboxylase alpha subunit
MRQTPTTAEPAASLLPAAAGWQEAVFGAFREAGIRLVAYVPDAGLGYFIQRAQADPAIQDVVLTTEEEGVALVSGAWLGGQRAVMLMQSSGVGNCVNMFSLLQMCQFPFFTLVTMRGEYAEFNPWQGPMGRATDRVLELMGISVLRVNRPEEAGDVVAAGLESAFEAGERVAVVLSQQLLGRKKWNR